MSAPARTDDAPTVRLGVAYSWDCPKCATPNFVRAVAWKATDDEIREQFGLSPGDPIPDEMRGGWQTSPDRVMCRECRAAFTTEEQDDDC